MFPVSGENPLSEEIRRKNIVAEDEDVVFMVRQRRSANPFFPYYAILTDRQIIKYSPGLLGHETETRSVGDIDDVDVEAGLFTSKIVIESHGLDDFVLMGLPGSAGDRLRNEIQKLKQEN